MWNGLLKIIEIQHKDKNGNILWEDKNIKNMFHTVGQQFILNSCFLGGNSSNIYIPSSYYFGLDNRVALNASDTMTTIADSGGEPNSNGYLRQSVSSTTSFTVATVSGVFQASSPIITFSATGGSWGPVANLFLTTTNDYTGVLISSIALSQSITVSATQSVSMRMALSLQDCVSCS